MTTLAQPRLRVPRSVRAGEAFEVRCLIEHPMETGLRAEAGRTVPRDMLNRLTLRVNGEVAFEAELLNGTAANPYHLFFLRLDRTSELDFTWSDERGHSVRASARVAVT